MSDPVIRHAKEGFERSIAQFTRLLDKTPDDKVAWAPSPTSRSILHIAFHVADAVGNMHGIFDGRPFAVESTEEAERLFRESEVGVTSLVEVKERLKANCDAYVSWLDSLDPARLDVMVEMPFGMVQLPVRATLGFPAMHTDWHAAQIAYVQTIYGDQAWH